MVKQIKNNKGQKHSLSNIKVKVYHGYGHAHNMTIFGHVLQTEQKNDEQDYPDGVFKNLLRLASLFFVKPIAGVKLRMTWEGQQLYTRTAKDGFFKFQWQASNSVPAGLHEVQIDLLNINDRPVISAKGSIYVPHITQYAFISDIDDTVLVSHSATVFKRLRTLFLHNPHTRTAFPEVVEHYRKLSLAQTNEETPNPFYYVSSSEWNLYDDLVSFFQYNKLPDGALLLNHLKQWWQLAKTGKTKHEGKYTRIVRLFNTFPNQQFVLLGDNSQKDPDIYQKIAEKYPDRVFAIYIRNVRSDRTDETLSILDGLEKKGIHTSLYISSNEAIEHSQKIGLL